MRGSTGRGVGLVQKGGPVGQLLSTLAKGNGPKLVGPFKGKGKLQPAREAQPVWRARGDVGPSTGGRQQRETSKKPSIPAEKLPTASQQVETTAIRSLEDTEVAEDIVVGDNVSVAELWVDSQANLGQTMSMDKRAEPPLEILPATVSTTA